jgi:hypothetical protein
MYILKKKKGEGEKKREGWDCLWKVAYDFETTPIFSYKGNAR